MDLSTTYLGLKLKNPIVPSAGPLSRNLDSIRRLEDAEAAAVVIYSLFEEQIDLEGRQLDHFLNYGSQSTAEAMSYFPEMDSYNIGPREYLELVKNAKKAVKIPIIASLNGVSLGGWTGYAKRMEEAGADALELNVYFIPTDPTLTGAEVEHRYIDVLENVKKQVKIPVAIKIGPYFSSMGNMAGRLADAGANGLVLFNRFYQPDLDLDNLEVVPNLTLSGQAALRLPLRWVAILHGRVKADLALTGGIHTHQDVLKAMMAGANVAMVCSEFLQNGIGRIREMLYGMRTWMEDNDYESIQQMRGSMSQKHVAEPAAFERANYMKVLQSFRPDPTGRMT